MGLFDFLKKKELEEIAQLKSELNRYKSITDIEREANKQQELLEKYITDKESEIKTIQDNIAKLNSDYQNALET